MWKEDMPGNLSGTGIGYQVTSTKNILIMHGQMHQSELTEVY